MRFSFASPTRVAWSEDISAFRTAETLASRKFSLSPAAHSTNRRRGGGGGLRSSGHRGRCGIAVAQRRSFRRTCQNLCPVIATIEEGRLVGLRGDPDGPLHHGYTCIKGREHRRFYDHPERLRQSLVRNVGDGTRTPISTAQAIDAIAQRLTGIVDAYGPRSVAVFGGSYAYTDHPANLTMIDAFMRALGSPMFFSTTSIDQSGKPVALAMHGVWMAPGKGALDPGAMLLIGNNPLISHMSWAGNPGDFFKGIDERGASLIVIDPRRTETARRARIHLQARPGHDVGLVAAMLNLIFGEGLIDADFLAENVDGVTSLRAAVSRFDPGRVAELAGVPVDDLVTASRLFASADGAYAISGTGPGMGGRSTLLEYLVLCLQTVCGHWSRAGDPIPNALTVLPEYMQRRYAQAAAPYPGHDYGEPSRVRGLGQTGNGMPTATAAEEILLEGEGQIRALISLGGNPVGFPGSPVNRLIDNTSEFDRYTGQPRMSNIPVVVTPRVP